MSLRICISPIFLVVLAGLTACSKNGTPSYNPDVGPFDEDGNYVEAWADNPPKRGSKLRKSEPKPDPKPVVAKVARPIEKARPVISKVTPKPPVKPTTVYKPKPKPKPKTVYKPKPKPKPKTIRHTVRKGDTLYSLARRYGTTVSKIKRANGLSSNVIRTGKTYTIPK